MSDLELAKLEELITSAIKGKKTSLFSVETIIKLGFALIMGSFAYAGMSYNVASVSKDVIEIKITQKEQKEKDELKFEALKLQVQTCQVQIAVLNQQMKDLQSNQNK